jgi:hypothetical protein
VWCQEWLPTSVKSQVISSPHRSPWTEEHGGDPPRAAAVFGGGEPVG